MFVRPWILRGKIDVMGEPKKVVGSQMYWKLFEAMKTEALPLVLVGVAFAGLLAVEAF